MVSVSEAFNTWNEGFANKDSSKLAEFFTEDFRFVSSQFNLNKQETLDWTASNAETKLSNLEVLYENDEVAVVYHNATGGINASSAGSHALIMALYTKKDGKFSQVRLVRQEV